MNEQGPITAALEREIKNELRKRGIVVWLDRRAVYSDYVDALLVNAGVDLSEELMRLAIHGSLHLLGNDHPEGPERTKSPMFLLQERLLSEVVGGE